MLSFRKNILYLPEAVSSSLDSNFFSSSTECPKQKIGNILWVGHLDPAHPEPLILRNNSLMPDAFVTGQELN